VKGFSTPPTLLSIKIFTLTDFTYVKSNISITGLYIYLKNKLGICDLIQLDDNRLLLVLIWQETSHSRMPFTTMFGPSSGIVNKACVQKLSFRFEKEPSL
jgi:hypothetical protein